MTSSASSKARATTGSRRRSSASMFAYCEPWPVYRKATLRGGRCRGGCRGRAAPARRPGCPRPSARERELRLRDQVGGVAVVDRDPLGRPQRVAAGSGVGSRWRPGAPPPARSRSARRARPRPSAPSTSAPRSGGFAGAGARGGAAAAPAARPARDHGRRRAIAVAVVRTVRARTPPGPAWKFVPPKPNALTPAARGRPAAAVPVAQLGVDRERATPTSRDWGWAARS